jgi:choline dehydrogenase-like flavoprotein
MPKRGGLKLRVPGLASCFAGFQEHYKVTDDGLHVTGSLSSGGLSNAWGAGVATFSNLETADWPINHHELRKSYDRVTCRIGVQGVQQDPMTSVFGDMQGLQPPPPLNANARFILENAERQTTALERDGFRLGRARNAVITRETAGRSACDLKATCLYGCASRSIYSARFDLEWLLKQPNVTYRALRVTSIEPSASGYQVRGHSDDGCEVAPIEAENVVLAAGTIGSTALILGLKKAYGKKLRLLTAPQAAYAILLPRRLGQLHPDHDFALAQLSISVELDAIRCGPAFGNLFSTSGLGLTGFVQRFPLGRVASLRLMSLLSPAMLVGNCYLPGETSDNDICLLPDGGLHLSGRVTETQIQALAELKRRLSRTMRKLGAVLVPTSFSKAGPGRDVHYAATLPMRRNPEAFETNEDGELAGFRGLHIVDGAVLPRLPAKAHTLTIMANADRIGRSLVKRRLMAELLPVV